MLNMVLEICNTQLEFDSFEEVNPYFKRIINTLKQMNYSAFESEQFKNFENELMATLNERKAA